MVESAPMNSEAIYFVSVGRVRDQTMLATCKTSNRVTSEHDQDIRDHCLTLLCRQSNQVMGARQKSVHLNMAWHMFQDKNMISYVIVTHADFPDEYAHNFLKGLSNMLYERSSEFKKNPQSI
mmetsp:Transcript_39557/g.51823  ORF Transcript_39557/g.51823 Transcript_39557/m.51823 type:complete len:122 (+) Transcript_39557:53-418(+)